MNNEFSALIKKVESLVDRIEPLFPQKIKTPDWRTTVACRWKYYNSIGFLQPVEIPDGIVMRDLYAIKEQKKRIEQNTRQFIDGYPSNNVLLTGSKGTGKSSLVKALLNKYKKNKLRLIEVEKNELKELPQILDLIQNEPFRFIIFCDDLSFGAEDEAYKALKVALDGSVSAASDNVLIYATSNRRHLLPEYMSENLETRYVGEEIHQGENVEEKISLSERFGIWVHFDSFTQEEYLEIVFYWVAKLSRGTIDPDQTIARNALQWALERGSRSGRIAFQFAKDEVGSKALFAKKNKKP